MNFPALLAKLFLTVAGISWEASVLVCLVLAIRLLFGRGLPTRWRSALWLLVLARLLLPILPASPFSIYQIGAPSVKLTLVVSAKTSANSASSSSGAPHASTRTLFSSDDWFVRGVQLATVLWILGMVTLASAMAWSNLRFIRALRRDQRAPTRDALQLARSCADELGVRHPFDVFETSLVGSPAIYGLWRAKLLLPLDLTHGLNSDELRLVLLHELAHLRRADLYHHALLSMLQVVHWFNPILWLAFARMRDDREMATDALVLSGRRAALKTQYGHTLLKLIESAQGHSLPVQLVGILENPGQLKDRLTRIRQATPGGYRWSKGGLALLCVLGALCLTRAYGDARTLVIQSRVTEQPWNGWGFAAPDDAPAPLLPDEQFSLVRDSPSPRTFSGKVVIDGPLTGVEVGIVSLVGVHWVNPDAYQWQAVNPDGTFSLTDAHYPTAPKTLVVRGPQTPWTFLRYNFASNESATDILLHGDSARKITLGVSGEDGRELDHSSFEFFPAHAQFDDNHHPLRRQRLGDFETGDATQIEVAVPSGEVAVFAHHDGYASYYQVIDTRQAEHFRFVLQTPGRMKITVLDQAGNPKPGLRVNWVNPAAPLSLSGTSTDGNGVIVQDNLSPGSLEVQPEGFKAQQVKVEENELTEVIFRAETPP